MPLVTMSLDTRRFVWREILRDEVGVQGEGYYVDDVDVEDNEEVNKEDGVHKLNRDGRPKRKVDLG